jgi:proteasome accessory factor B
MSKKPLKQPRQNAAGSAKSTAALSSTDGNETIDAARVGRNATERLLAIHQLISARRYPNTARLARDFDVSQKTVKRDVEWMRVHWDLPIEYDRQRQGYFYSREVKQFPGLPTVTEAEMFALLVAHKALEQYTGTPFHKPLQMAFRKLTGQLDDQERYSLEGDDVLSFRPFAPEATDLERFEIVARAVQQRRALSFLYRKPGQKTAGGRQVHPYHLTCNDNRWYLIGHDVDRGEIRTFALSRIHGSAALGDTFQKPKDFSVAKYLRGSLTVMSGQGDYEVVLEFDAWATDQLRGRLWHASQQISELPGGESRMRMRLSALEEVERWVLSWGAHATVIQPQLLAERVGCIARALSSRYETP